MPKIVLLHFNKTNLYNGDIIKHPTSSTTPSRVNPATLRASYQHSELNEDNIDNPTITRSPTRKQVTPGAPTKPNNNPPADNGNNYKESLYLSNKDDNTRNNSIDDLAYKDSPSPSASRTKKTPPNATPNQSNKQTYLSPGPRLKQVKFAADAEAVLNRRKDQLDNTRLRRVSIKAIGLATKLSPPDEDAPSKTIGRDPKYHIEPNLNYPPSGHYSIQDLKYIYIRDIHPHIENFKYKEVMSGIWDDTFDNQKAGTLHFEPVTNAGKHSKFSKYYSTIDMDLFKRIFDKDPRNVALSSGYPRGGTNKIDNLTAKSNSHIASVEREARRAEANFNRRINNLARKKNNLNQRNLMAIIEQMKEVPNNKAIPTSTSKAPLTPNDPSLKHITVRQSKAPRTTPYIRPSIKELETTVTEQGSPSPKIERKSIQREVDLETKRD
ncbi:uncharacterized protein B0T23DRAFT_416604 [Neurospora hispaniola]|uniref:Uncharacterized protein n=1 Tax=Neurospora hispaniola TaxID=588809 RepID=A0AAJ0IF12_9PEZI|nr:hypothetical protein B0T23DRAFT_416604 [Neurospora hispaniola]